MSQVFPFSPFATRYSHYKKATPTIQHWELRDLVHCESSEEVVITEGFGIYKVDFRNQVKSPLYLLDFKPTCFSVHGGILAAGGMGGKLKVVRLEDGRIFYAGNLGTHVINSVLVTQRGNDKLLFIVSNSRLLQGFRLDEDCSSELVLICRYESCTCLNYVALSPDGRLLLTVGDSGEYFIYSVQDAFRVISSFRICTRPALCCAWSANSQYFAVASQDGHCYLLETETEKLVTRLGSWQSNGFNSACSCVKFCPNNVLDLLTFTENSNYIHLVDIRDVNGHQMEYFGDSDRDVDIAGTCFNPQGDKLFVGTSQGIYAYEISTAQRRSFGKGDFT